MNEACKNSWYFRIEKKNNNSFLVKHKWNSQLQYRLKLQSKKMQQMLYEEYNNML